MKISLSIGLMLSLMATLSLHATYIDENGVERMGDAPPGVKTLNKKGDILDARGKLPKWEPVPDRFGAVPSRVIDGKVYDFRPVIEWANEKAFLASKAPTNIVTSSSSSSSSSTTGTTTSNKSKISLPGIADWEDRTKANQTLDSKYQRFWVAGKVLQVIPDGLLVKPASSATSSSLTKILLKNHPRQNELVDGDYIEVVALPSGSYRNAGVLGTKTTIRAFDYGRAFQDSDSVLPRADIPLADTKSQ